MELLATESHEKTTLSLRDPVALESFFRRYYGQVLEIVNALQEGKRTVADSASMMNGTVKFYAEVLAGERTLPGYALDPDYHQKDLPMALCLAFEIDGSGGVTDVYAKVLNALVLSLKNLLSTSEDGEIKANIDGLLTLSIKMFGANQ